MRVSLLGDIFATDVAKQEATWAGHFVAPLRFVELSLALGIGALPNARLLFIKFVIHFVLFFIVSNCSSPSSCGSIYIYSRGTRFIYSYSTPYHTLVIASSTDVRTEVSRSFSTSLHLSGIWLFSPQSVQVSLKHSGQRSMMPAPSAISTYMIQRVKNSTVQYKLAPIVS